MRSISSAETALGNTECRQVRTGNCADKPCRNDSGAGQEAQECAHSRNGLPATPWLEFGGFAPNQINYGIRAKVLPFDLGMTKTLIQEPTSVEEVITTTSRSTA